MFSRRYIYQSLGRIRRGNKLRIPEDVIEEVRSRNNIVDVISSYVKLQKKGGSYMGLCPFHNEKSGSFAVSPNKQMFHCFGCHEGGNVFSFLMKYENITFLEAVKILADRAGIKLPEIEMSEEDRRQNDLKSMIYEANTEAAKFYHYLLSTPEGENARAYFAKRELQDKTIISFGLGVSSMRRDSLYRYLKSKNYKDNILKETGLFVYDEKGVHDRFRNRAMFPIINTSGKVIGFGGRVMGEGEPKYLNSPETVAFDKGRNLYGLNVAKSSRKNNIIICEGYMDVISMHQAGFTQAVASLGTALTSGQAMLIKRYVQDVLICYDSDGAGVKAAIRAISIFRDAGLRTKVINMQPYKDADEFIKAEGAEAFAERINNAENSFLFEVRKTAEKYNLNDPDEKTSFYNEIARKLTEFEDELVRNNYLEVFTSQYNIPIDAMRKKISQYAATTYNQEVKAEEKRKPSVKDDGLKKAQRMILTRISDEPYIYDRIKKHISASDFTEDIYKRVAQIMFEQLDNGKFNAATILNYFDGDENHNEVAEILNTNFIDEDASLSDKEKSITEAVLMIKKNSLEVRGRNATDISEIQAIFNEQRELASLQISLS